MNPFRFFNHVKLQEVNLASFISLIPEFIQIGEQTEPDMLQYEAFANHERNEE